MPGRTPREARKKGEGVEGVGWGMVGAINTPATRKYISTNRTDLEARTNTDTNGRMELTQRHAWKKNIRVSAHASQSAETRAILYEFVMQPTGGTLEEKRKQQPSTNRVHCHFVA